MSTKKEQFTIDDQKTDEKPLNSKSQDIKNEIVDLQIKKRDFNLQKKITFLSSSKDGDKLTEQFINILEIGIYNKKIENVVFEIQYFNSKRELYNIWIYVIIRK